MPSSGQLERFRHVEAASAPLDTPRIEQHCARGDSHDGQDQHHRVDTQRGETPPQRRNLTPSARVCAISPSFSYGRRYPSEMSTIPVTTAMAPSSRPIPIFSRPPIASTAVAMTTLDSRTAATEAAGARRNAASARA